MAGRIFGVVPRNPAKPKVVANVEALVERASVHLAEHGVVKLTSVAPKAAREAVISALVARGFEPTKNSLRVPLLSQLKDAVAHGAMIALSALPAHVRGATKAELKSAADTAIREGIVVRVLRGRAESVVAVGAPVLSAETLGSLATQLATITKALHKAQKTRALTLLAADVREALEKALQAMPVAEKKQSAASPLHRVLQTVDSMRDSKTGLSFIPHVLTELAKTMDPKAATDALLAAAASDLLELRPEGGLARLSQTELALCPPGPQGTRLSWARRLSGETT